MPIYSPSSPFLQILKDRLDPLINPFTERGSRVLVHLNHDRSSFSICLAERLMNLQSGLEDHLQRPAFIPELELIDENGQTLEFRLTTYPHALFMDTEIGVFRICFYGEDTLAVGLPDQARCGIQAAVSPGLWKAFPRGGCLRESRQLSYQASAPLEENKLLFHPRGKLIQLISKPGFDQAVFLTIRSEAGEHPPLLPFCRVLADAHDRWHAWFEQVPPVPEEHRAMYYYAWWVLGSNLVSPKGCLKRTAAMPSKAHYIGIWNWDAAFHALGLRHGHIELARDQIRAILDGQEPDGMLPDVIHDEGTVTWIDHPLPGTVTKPPVAAWAAARLHEKSPDLPFLEEIYPGLKKWSDWWFKHTDSSTSLPVYTHPYSSGADDNPLWDHGFPVFSPDLLSYLVVQMESLAWIARELGLDAEGQDWLARANALADRLTAELYDSESGLFLAYTNGEPIPEVTFLNLLPLWTGRLPDEAAQSLLSHLTNPDEFWGEFPLCTVSRKTEAFSPHTMWRGPVWVNINYLFIEALRRIGKEQLADDLRDRTLAMIEAQEDLFEYYRPEKGPPPPGAVTMFGWTAALYIDLVLQSTGEER